VMLGRLEPGGCVEATRHLPKLAGADHPSYRGTRRARGLEISRSREAPGKAARSDRTTLAWLVTFRRHLFITTDILLHTDRTVSSRDRGSVGNGVWRRVYGSHRHARRLADALDVDPGVENIITKRRERIARPSGAGSGSGPGATSARSQSAIRATRPAAADRRAPRTVLDQWRIIADSFRGLPTMPGRLGARVQRKRKKPGEIMAK
jgi:hypothetical protein